MITVSWDNAEKRLLCTTFQKPWTWQEWDAAAKIISEKLAAVDHKIYMVQDVRLAGFPPSGGVWRFRQIANSMDENVERIIFIGMASFVQNLLETLHKLSFGHMQKGRFIFAADIDEARALLPSLPNEPVPAVVAEIPHTVSI